ncbi:hypothetical protein AVEN_250493-1 [Araneus ventricosus]|uniref:Uncharacterized protein n=1 Tax=Araneus ventricosus TaxID=182803 RepID=A0A4Y2QWN2_ARAVE|nr:hypothetical protein AVEN_250493-1 [Araneus ventricosus]
MMAGLEAVGFFEGRRVFRWLQNEHGMGSNYPCPPQPFPCVLRLNSMILAGLKRLASFEGSEVFRWLRDKSTVWGPIILAHHSPFPCVLKAWMMAEFEAVGFF